MMCEIPHTTEGPCITPFFTVIHACVATFVSIRVMPLISPCTNLPIILIGDQLRVMSFGICFQCSRNIVISLTPFSLLLLSRLALPNVNLISTTGLPSIRAVIDLFFDLEQCRILAL